MRRSLGQVDLWVYILVSFCCHDNTMIKAAQGGVKVYLTYTSRSQFITEENQGRNLCQESGAGTVEGCYWLGHSQLYSQVHA